MDDRKIYSEQEAADLIVAAAKLQEAEGDGASYRAGVTWTEMQKMADDVGVDPEYLRKVLAGQAGVVSKKNRKPRQFMGMPLSEEFERVVDAELPPESFDVIAGEFYNPGYGGGGQGMYGGPSIIGRMMKGQFYEGILYGSLEVSSRHGRTRIKARTSNAVATWAIWLPIMFVGLMIALPVTIKKSPENIWLALAIWGAIGGGFWAALGASLQSGLQRTREKLDRIAIAVEDEAALIRKNLSSATSVQTSEADSVRQNLSGD